MTAPARSLQLADEFNRYFTSANGVDVGERVSVPRDEWRKLFAILESIASADEGVPVVGWPRINKRMEYAAQDEYHILPPRLKRLWARLEALADKPSLAALSAQSTAADEMAVALRAVVDAHEANMSELGAVMRAANIKQITLPPGLAASTIQSQDAVESARAALAAHEARGGKG